MLLIIGYSVWNKWVFKTVRACTVGYLFLGCNRPVNESSRCAGNRQWRMCDCETNCLNSLLHRLSCLSDNKVSLNRQHASSYGMLPAIICSVRRWMFPSDVVCCFVRLVCQAGHAYSKAVSTAMFLLQLQCEPAAHQVCCQQRWWQGDGNTGRESSPRHR